MMARQESAAVCAAVTTPPAPGCPGPPPQSYIEERRRDNLVRLRRAALVALLPIAAGAILNVFTFPDRLHDRLATFGTEACLCLAALALSRRPGAHRWAIPLTVTFAVTMGAALVWALSLTPRDVDVLAAVLPATMIAMTLIFPWGGGAQGIVSAFLALGYLMLPWPEFDHGRWVNVLITLSFGVVLSVVGAFILDRYRHEGFRRSALLREEAEASAALLHVAKTVNARLGRPDMLEEVTRLTVEVLGGDWSSLYVWDDRREAFTLRANAGGRPEIRAEVEQIEFSGDTFGIVRAIRPGELLELPDCSHQTLVPPALMERWGIASMLGASISCRGQIVGALVGGYRTRTGDFSSKQRRLVQGIAEVVAIALENARLVADLEAASRLKSEFVATMSHELRTPLNVITGYTELLHDGTFGPLSTDQRDTLRRVQKATLELLDLVNATLDLGRLEAGRDEALPAPVTVRDVLEDVRAEVEALIPAAVAFHWRNMVGVETILSDRTKIKTILKNLVGNALKFTPRGTVEVTVTRAGERLIFEVRDTGIGIAPQQLPVIFEMFRQADSSSTRQFGGVGLGLHIVKRLVHLLGGTIAVSSTPDVGSVFTVRIPAPLVEGIRATGT